MAELPLEGRRIVVTRPREQAAELAEALEQLGAEAVIVPLVAIEPVEDERPLAAALRELDSYGWVVVTSANGVAAAQRARSGAAFGAAARVAAVGPGTARAVRELGVEPAFVPDVYAAEEIAAGLGPLEGIRVLLLQADIASPSLAEELRDRGAKLDAIVAYRTVETTPSPAGLAELERGADAIVLASGSAARSLAAVGLSSPFRETQVVCIGPKTAEAARDAGLTVGLVAHEASAEGIIHALVSHFGETMQ
ncbi:MAG: uroporphyrinogen-III synthase [Gaiellaceae bacterium]